MKELSIEQKAKAYDKAIERAREWSETKNGYYMPKELCEEIFPELRESDDERIRKAISDILLIDSDEMREILDANNVLMQDIDAWLEKQYADPIKEYWRGYNEGKQYVLDKYAELEKQGEQKSAEFKPSFRVGDVIKPKDPVLGEPRIIKGIHPKFGYGTNNGILDFEFEDNWELVEQKPANKVEPKFHEGEWIISDTVNKDYHICKITSIKDGNYTIESIYGYKGYNTFETFENDYHLWTIEDAKAGDVLFQDLMGGKTFIYNGVNSDMAILYSFIINNDGEDVLPYHIGKPNTGIGTIEENKNIIHPATKEQHDQLKKAMADAGYTFDFEKKELKKIEQKSTWSEEDETNILYILAALDCYYRLRKERNNTSGQENLDKARNWLYNKLKSLKHQKQWKPTEEQLYWLKQVIPNNSTSVSNEMEVLSELYRQLKAL